MNNKKVSAPAVGTNLGDAKKAMQSEFPEYDHMRVELGENFEQWVSARVDDVMKRKKRDQERSRCTHIQRQLAQMRQNDNRGVQVLFYWGVLGVELHCQK